MRPMLGMRAGHPCSEPPFTSPWRSSPSPGAGGGVRGEGGLSWFVLDGQKDKKVGEAFSSFFVVLLGTAWKFPSGLRFAPLADGCFRRFGSPKIHEWTAHEWICPSPRLHQVGIE